MTVYRLLANPDEYQSLTTYGMQRWDRQPHWFRGKPIAAEWVTPSMAIYEDERRKFLPGDFSMLLATIPVFSERAVEALGDILRDSGELLPIHTPQGTVLAFNTLKVLDALDEERSGIVRHASGGILSIPRYVFHEATVGDAPIFKVPETLVDTFVTDSFVHRVEEAGLRGFHFEPEWPLPEPKPRRAGRQRRSKSDAS